MKPGHKINSWLNGEWAKHARYRKKLGSKRRRAWQKDLIKEHLAD